MHTQSTLLTILVLCRIALRSLHGKTTHKCLTAVTRNPVSKDTLSQKVKEYVIALFLVTWRQRDTVLI